jgi:hypothetical protein
MGKQIIFWQINSWSFVLNLFLSEIRLCSWQASSWIIADALAGLPHWGAFRLTLAPAICLRFSIEAFHLAINGLSQDSLMVAISHRLHGQSKNPSENIPCTLNRPTQFSRFSEVGEVGEKRKRTFVWGWSWHPPLWLQMSCDYVWFYENWLVLHATDVLLLNGTIVRSYRLSARTLELASTVCLRHLKIMLSAETNSLCVWHRNRCRPTWFATRDFPEPG